ncbi:hypothetical protein D9611_000137 [Ephemerocybe angulata]|uniref:Altered inheritance of mitochondria protein 41 n=1 Tax=Ephemerocybe angulata TaxID=980116 RepID=A0A8H5F727_9AGAR|nr:hypothetical protein D9611_000137 [Tulosesus angulatus]
MLARIIQRQARCSAWQMSNARWNSTVADSDLRTRIMGEIKSAMKNKDTFTSMTLRSVLSEVYNADKAAPEGKITSEKIATILRKAFERRTEAISKFQAASRGDLAEKELKEVEIIAKFLPPVLTEAEVDGILSSILAKLPAGTNPPQRALGMVFKEFYAQVDKSRVDAELLKRRAQALLQARS